MSGGGKSITLEMLKRNLILLNEDQEFDVLSFDMEMPSKDQVVRNISALTKTDTETLYSVERPLENLEMSKVDKAIDELNKMPVYIVDMAGSVDEIYYTILDFVRTRQLAKRKRNIIITLDHTLLTKGKQGQAEKQYVDELMHMFVGLKKELAHLGVHSLIMILSQLNRQIEGKDRIINSSLHYPNKTDIFAASSVYHSSDYVIIPHKPCLINGINQWYGPPQGTKHPKGLPVFNPANPDQPMVYWHIIKNRFGKQGILSMGDLFSFASLEEIDLSI
jgi:hypothetical protein